jgi:hypothetical protein
MYVHEIACRFFLYMFGRHVLLFAANGARKRTSQFGVKKKHPGPARMSWHFCWRGSSFQSIFVPGSFFFFYCVPSHFLTHSDPCFWIYFCLDLDERRHLRPVRRGRERRRQRPGRRRGRGRRQGAAACRAAAPAARLGPGRPRARARRAGGARRGPGGAGGARDRVQGGRKGVCRGVEW